MAFGALLNLIWLAIVIILILSLIINAWGNVLILGIVAVILTGFILYNKYSKIGGLSRSRI